MKVSRAAGRQLLSVKLQKHWSVWKMIAEASVLIIFQTLLYFLQH